MEYFLVIATVIGGHITSGGQITDVQKVSNTPFEYLHECADHVADATAILGRQVTCMQANHIQAISEK